MTLSPDIIEGLPSVEGILNYLARMAERPMNLAYDPPPGVSRSTGEPEPHRVVIYDARPLAGRLSLDSEGLAVVKHDHADHTPGAAYRDRSVPETMRVRRDPTSLEPATLPEFIAGGRQWDDFIIDENAGIACVTTHRENTIDRVRLEPDGNP